MGLIVKASTSDNAGVEVPAAWKPVAAWLKVLVAPGANVEMRAVGVSRIRTDQTHAESAHYCNDGDRLDSMAKAALALTPRAEAIYWTLNPLSSDPALEGRPSTAADVLRRHWMLVDCDPIRDAKVSSTNDEKMLAWMTSRSILQTLKASGWPDPVEADSGNGYHLLYRVELPTEDGGLVQRTLHGLAKQFNSQGVKVDTTIFDPSRICKLYGTLARKGPNTNERPHRPSSILAIPTQLQVVTKEQLEAVAVPAELVEPIKPRGKAAPTPAPAPAKGLIAKAGATDPISRATIYAQRCQAAVSGQSGHNQTFKVCVAVGPGFDLDKDVAYGIIRDHYNPRCEPPWDEKDLRRKIDQAYEKEVQRGWLLRIAHKGGTANPKPGTTKGGEEGGDVLEGNADPHRLGRLILRQHYHHADSGRATLTYWGEEWYRWHDGAWRTCSPDEVGAELTGLVKAEFDRIARESGKTAQAVTRSILGNTMQALKDLALLPTWEVPKQPVWLDDKAKEFGDPVSYLCTSNALVHLPNLVEGQPHTYSPTPRFFSMNNLGYDFDPSAPRPEAWMQFLADLWPDDTEAINCLQEWMGYLLTPDASQGKILMVIGPKRSGKGTIARVIAGLVGQANVAAPTLASLEKNFGLQPLIGKLVAIIGDARLSGRADSQAIIERLLSISGQDTQTIDRKHSSFWTGPLPTRFMLISNELPRLADASGAMPSRMILLRMTRSFYGKEDTLLTERLLLERPAILLWAIAGWERLRQRGYFLQPESGKELLDDLNELSSPIASFVEEECVVGPEHSVPIPELFAAWKKWCEARGKDHPGDEAGFGRNLRASVPSVKTIRPRVENGRMRVYVGIGLVNAHQGELY